VGSLFAVVGRLTGADMEAILTAQVERVRRCVMLSPAFSGEVEPVFENFQSITAFGGSRNRQPQSSRPSRSSPVNDRLLEAGGCHSGA